MKNFYTTSELDKTIMLKIHGTDVDGRVWCTGVLRRDKTHRMREFDGFFHLNKLEKIK